MTTQLANVVGKLCAPPGAGWAASKSGIAPLAARLHKHMFDTDNVDAVRKSWLTALQPATFKVAVLGVPYDGGTYGLSGASAGPLGIRLAAMSQEMPWIDLGDIRYLPGPPTDDLWSRAAIASIRSERYGDPDSIWPVSVLSAAQRVVAASVEAGHRVVTIGGDHSVSASAIIPAAQRKAGLIHIDAHPDLSTGRDGLTLLHNSWIHVADRAIDFAHIAQVGVLDPGEPPAWASSRVQQISRRDLELDPAEAARRIGARLADCGCTGAYLSVDIDAIDSAQAPATGLPAEDGLQLDAVREFVAALPRALGQLQLLGADIAEVAPPLGTVSDWSEEPTCVAAAALLLEIVAAFSSDMS